MRNPPSFHGKENALRALGNRLSADPDTVADRTLSLISVSAELVGRNRIAIATITPDPLTRQENILRLVMSLIFATAFRVGKGILRAV